MSPKSVTKSRRKNSAPKRVIRIDEDDDETVIAKNTIALPKDPTALAKYISEKNITDFFTLPTVPDVFFEIVQKAKEEATEGQDLQFTCSVCNEKNYRSAAGLHYHLMNNCPKQETLAITCIICQKQCFDSEKMMEHIQEEHVYMYLGAPASEAARRRAARQSRLKIQMFAESSSVAEELERFYSSLSDCDEEEKQEQLSNDKNKETKKKETVKDPEVIPRQPRSGSSGTYTSVQNPLSDAFNWTFLQRKELEKKFSCVHSQIQINFKQWLQLKSKNLYKTLKLHRESPNFYIENEILNTTRSGKRNSKNVITNKANGKNFADNKKKKAVIEESVNYEKLRLFETYKTSDSHKTTFFVGGPTWSMAWCPYSINKDSFEQYLALCTHTGEHSLDSQILYQENVLLQIWNCGKLPVKASSSNVLEPSLAYGIFLNVGPVWSLKWCPIADSILDASKKHQRLGILALACSSGDVRLYALPKSCSENDSLKFPSHGCIYRVSPNLILKPLRNGHFGQCKCVCWSLEDGANFIAAGFASGHVALWNLKNHSKFLTCADDDGNNILYSFHTFRAHSKSLEDIIFCPYNSNYFISVAADRCLRMWDQRNTDVEIPNFLPPKMSIIYELDWPLLWCGVYAASDSAFSIPYFHGSIFLNMGSTANTLQNVVPPKASSWSVTACDWLNSAAGSDVAGNVILNICNNWNRLFISNKSYPRILLFQTDVEWNCETASSIYLTDSLDFDEELNKKYNLIFHDCHLSDTVSKWKDTEAHLRVRTFEDFADESYNLPVAAIHKVRWNPNLSSFTWIASATYSGLVRLHCVSGLLSDEVQDNLSHCR